MTTNIYHRYLNLNFKYPKPKVFDCGYHDFLRFMPTEVIEPEFRNLIQILGLTFSNVIEAFYTPPNGGRIPLHTDTCWIPGVSDVAKINFTWGPEDSTTQWFKIRDEKLLIVHDNHRVNKEVNNRVIPDFDITKTYTAFYKDVDLVHEAVINRPSLMNVGQLHSTFNPGREHRWTLSFTFFDCRTGNLLRFSDALIILSDYIEHV